MSRPENNIDPGALTAWIARQPTPIQRQQQEAALADQQQQIEDRRQAAAKLALENQQARIAFNEKQAVAQMIAAKAQQQVDPTIDDFAKVAPTTWDLHAKTYFGAKADQAKLAADNLATQKGQFELQQQQSTKAQADQDAIAEAQSEARAMPLPQRMQAVPDILKRLVQAGHMTADQATAALDPSHWTDAELDTDINTNHSAITAKRKKAAEDIENGLKQAQTAAQTATAAKDNADVQKIQAAIAVNPRSPQEAINEVDAILPPTGDTAKANAAYKARLAATPFSPEGHGDIVKEAAAEAGKTRTAVATALAEIPGKLAVAAAEGANRREIANEGVALAKKQKIDEAYDAVLGGNEEITRAINMAAAGNKEAQAALPMMMVNKINALSGIKRANQAEFNSLGTAGSLLDSIQGRLGKITEGKPIPPDILKDAKSLFDSLAANGESARNRAYSTVDKNYGTKYSSTIQTGGTYTDGGRTFNIPADKVADFLKDHPNAKKQ